MKKKFFIILSLVTFIAIVLYTTLSSKKEEIIDVATTLEFEQYISSYNIYKGKQQDMLPTEDYHLFELKSVLFSNYAEKQRLIKLPKGEQMEMNGNGLPLFPNGTIMVKTFYYYNDARNPNNGNQLIETRLFIKNDEVWNVATYVWNDSQTDALLTKEGKDMEVSWITASGENQKIDYHVPSNNECASCHLSENKVAPLGPKMRNLNNNIAVNDSVVNQLQHLQSLGILNSFDVKTVSTIVDYNDLEASLSDRAKAYLEMNCAHCHSPKGWKPEGGYDFSYETSPKDGRIVEIKKEIKESIMDGTMPYMGVTVLDQGGINLIVEYIDSL
ncbi:hypothetical protein [uncultured Psychroserpens sp.]|uniref:hypothetical protein n=1 Tax=uncultured Psychroserpens sp. TaxID=255436 RepID=UPI002601AB43|nr:hypothetical protein [uncultured Psychroserpens sp.]